MLAFLPLLAARVRGEEVMLLNGLPDYREYAAKVPFRARRVVTSYPSGIG
jgi:protein-S-isoprenylcysteine O-methyltransferase Ste14